jgi:hypothetical protein
MMQTSENVGTDFALGTELMVNYSPTRWYTLNFIADYYKYDLKVDFDTLNYTQSNYNWGTRLNNTFRLGETTRFQLDVNYQSPSVRAQGKTYAFYAANAALRQDFFKRKLTATLQVRDIFSTGTRKFESKGKDFEQSTRFIPASPYVSLTLSYKLNNYKQRNGERGGDDMGGEGMEGGM